MLDNPDHQHFSVLNYLLTYSDTPWRRNQRPCQRTAAFLDNVTNNLSTCCGDPCRLSRLLWSLELASEFYPDDFAYYLGGKELLPAESQGWLLPFFCKGTGDAEGEEFQPDLNPLQERDSRRNTVATRFGRNLVTKNARSGAKDFVTGM